MNIYILNGPNLNLLGSREPSVYGNRSFESFLEELKKKYTEVVFTYLQSNVEGELINFLHLADGCDGILLNAGGYTHTSVALGDAVAAIRTPVIEVHISNVFAREEYRHVSMLSKHCKGVITGLGLQGYELALLSFLK